MRLMNFKLQSVSLSLKIAFSGIFPPRRRPRIYQHCFESKQPQSYDTRFSNSVTVNNPETKFEKQVALPVSYDTIGKVYC